MGSRTKGSFSIILALLMIATSVIFLNPSVADHIPIEEEEFVEDAISPPSRTIYSGTTYTVGSDPGDDSTTIQGAVDLCSDGDIVLVSPGSYQEEVSIDKEIWIMGSSGSKLEPLTVPIFNIGFNLQADNITISGFNITDFQTAIFSNRLGHNFSYNDFFSNGYSIRINMNLADIDYSYVVEDFIISHNTFTTSSTLNTVDIMVIIDYDEGDATITHPGNFMIMDNHYRSIATAGEFVEFSMNVYDKVGGELEIGDFVMTGNTLYGGGLGLDFNGDDVQNMVDVDIDIGEVRIVDNRIEEHDDGGINIDYYDIEHIYGTTTIDMEDVAINENNILTSGSSESIYISNFAYWRNLHNDSKVISGNVTIEENTLNGGSYGIYLSNSYTGYELEHNSMAITKNLFIRENVIQRSGNGIYLEMQDGYNFHDNSHGEMGDVVVTDNFVNSKYDGIHVYYFHLGADMHDNSTYTIGQLLLEGNEVYGSFENTGYDGIELYLEYIGYDLYNDSIVQMEGISIIDNDLWGDYGINWNYLEYFGYYLEGNSIFTMGDINISANRVRGISTAIYLSNIYENGYELYDHSNVSMGDISIDENTVWSENYGIFISNFEYLGYYMYNNSKFSFGDLSVSKNSIISSNNGLYINSLEYWGYEMYDHAKFKMGGLIFNGNDIISNNTGIYSHYIYDFGCYMYQNSSFRMENIEFNNNDIQTKNEGLFVYYIEYFGYNMDEWSTFMMGDIQLNNNTIKSGYYGIYLYEIYYMGYSMKGRAYFEMGNFEICYNEIISEDSGIYIEYYYEMAYEMYGTSRFVSGEILLSENRIITNGTGIYVLEFYDLGYMFYDEASAVFEGIHVDGNEIDALDRGIYVVTIEYLGEDLYDDSKFDFGNITFNDNLIRSGNDGITIGELSRLFSELAGNAESSIGWLMINNNQVDSDGTGISIMNWDYFGVQSKDNSIGRMEGIEVINNTILSDINGIDLGDGDHFASSMEGESSITMGPIMISENAIESGSSGIIFSQELMGSGMYSGDPVMEGVRITKNQIHTPGGIDVSFRTATMFDFANVTIKEVLIEDNVLKRGADSDAIYLRFDTIVTDHSIFEVERSTISHNLITGANVSVIHVNHAQSESGDGDSNLGTLEVIGNNITGGGTGLEFEGVESARVYVNNFIANIVDVESNTGLITWISPEQMWYRYGMQNYSSFLGNYWDSYNGPDNDNDGIGDNPYNTGFGLDNKPLARGTWKLLPPWNDVIPPEIVIDTPIFDAFISSENVTMTWTVTDDLIGVDSQWVRLDDGEWILVDVGSEYTFTYITEGPHQLWVKASDVAGNENMTFVNITIDMTSPEVWMVTPLDGAAFNVTDVEIEFNASDALSGIISFSISVDGDGPVNVGTDKKITLTNLSEGSHSVNVTAIDGAGVEGHVGITIIIDLTAPDLDIIHPTDGMTVIYDRINASWVGDGGPSGIMDYLYSIDGENLTNIGHATEKMIEDLESGTHKLRIVCYDGAGNFISMTSEFTVDTNASVVSITYPADGSYLNMTSFDSTWIINGMTQRVDAVEYRIDSGNWTTATFTGVAILDLEEGSHILDVRALDIKGGIAASTSHFTIDVTKPSILSVSHEGASALAEGPVVITFSEAIGSATITMNGDPISFELVGATITLSLDNITAGTAYLFQIDAIDMAGNSFSGPLSFTTAARGQVSGRIVDENGDPVEGARIVFDTGEEAITDENGEFSVAVSDGSRTAIVYDKDGNEIGSFDVDVTGGEDVDSGDQVVESKDDEDRFPWWILVLIAILVLILLGIVLFVLRTKGREAEEEEEDEFDDADDIWEDDEDDDDDDFDDEDDEDFDDDDDWDDE